MTKAEAITAIVRDRLGPSTVDEVLSIHAQLNEQCGGDLHQIADYARDVAEEFRRRRGVDLGGKENQ